MTHFKARPAASSQSIHPASAMQQAMLRRSLIAPQAGDYVQQFRWSWTGPLDTDAFTRAWAILSERHEVLRSSFELEEDGQFTMVVEPHTIIPVASSRVRQRKPASVEAYLERERIRDREQGFTLEESPLMRFAIHHLGRDRAEILWTSHHALFDGRGRLNLLREFRTLYRALIRGAIAELDPASRYTDYLTWHSRHHFCESDAFWRDLGKGAEPMSPLVAEPSASPSDRKERTRHSIRLTARTTKDLNSWSVTHGISLNTLTQGAWALVLARMSGRKAVSFGAPRAGRHPPVPEAASMVGVFVNTVPMQIAIDDRQSKLKWLRKIRWTWKEMRPHEQTPVGHIAKAWNWPEGRPLFDTLVGFEKYQLSELIGSGIDGVHWGFELEATTEIPLTVQVYDGHRIRIEMTSTVGSIGLGDLNRLVARMKKALINLIDPKDRPLGSLDCIPDAEARTLREWSRRKSPYPSRQTLHGLFSRQARDRPDAIALKTGDTILTYGEAETEANRLAHRLVDAGVLPGDRIGLLTDRSIDQVVAMLGILKAGAAYMPLDPEYPDARLRVLLKASKARLVLFDQNHQDRLGSGRLKRLPLKTDSALTGTGTADDRPPRVTIGPDSLAYVMFTSGSTGQPKGVEVPHRAVIRLLFGVDYVRLGPGNRMLYLAPASFDASTFEIWGALLHGGCCVVFPDRVPTISALEDCLRSERIDTLWLTCSLFNFLIDEAPEILKPVKQLLTGGEALSPPHIARAQNALPGTRLINGYGPTETTTFACCYPIPNGVRADQKSIPIGRPIGNTNCHIVDPDLRPVPIGATGELLIGGAGVALGYLNQSTKTAESFLPSPFHPGDRLYRTGDLVRWREDGLIEYVGRIDHQVKIRGHRIEPGEIEAALCRHPAIRQAAVLVATDPANGKSLSAWVAAPGRQRPRSQDLVQFLTKTLPAYLIPARIQVVSELPRNVNGKIDRRALAETPTEPPVAAAEPTGRPISEEENSIIRLFAEILHRPAVGPDESFFCIGGDSLQASRLIYRMSRETRVPFSLTDLHAAPTPRALARLARERTAESGDTTSARMIRLSNRDRARPGGTLTWYYKTFKPGSRRKGGNISRAFRIRGPLNPSALREAIDLFIARHESMRTRTWMDAEGTVRVTVERTARIVLQRRDLSGLPVHQRLARAKEAFREDAHKRINLAQVSTPRVKLTRLGEDDHFITFLFPHGHFDAVSLALFYEEVSAFYETLEKGEKPDWPMPKYHPIDYAAWERRQMTPALKRSLKPFWKETIAGPPPEPWFPSDGPVTGNDNGTDRTIHFLLPPELTSGLRGLSQRSGTTVFMAMLASNAVLVNRHTGQDDFLITSVVDGRAHPAATRMVGHLGQSLYFRARPDPDQSFTEFLGSSSREWMETVQHRAYPVGEVVEEVLKEQGRPGGKITPFFIVHGADDPDGLRLAGTRVSPVHRHFGAGPNLPKIEIRDTVEGISLLISYRTYTFRKSSILRYVRRWEEIIRQVVATPNVRIARLPDYRGETGSSSPAAQRHSVERKITEIMSSVLGCEPETPESSFYQMGGDSLQAVRLIYRITQTTGVDVTMSDLIRTPDAAGLTSTILARKGAKSETGPAPVIRLKKRERAPTTGSQRFYWRQHIDKKAGTISRAFRIRGRLNLKALRQAIRDFLARHEAMRTTMQADSAGNVTQTVHRASPFRLARRDLTDRPVRKRLSEAKREFRTDAETPFDLTRLPSMKVKVTRLGADDHFVSFIFTHAHFDAVSLALFYREISATYRALNRGESITFPPLKHQLIDFLVWEEKRAENRMKEMETFWEETLRHAPVDPWFPTDGPQKPANSAKGKTLHFHLAPELSKAVRNLSRRSGTTTFTTAVAIMTVLIQRHTGQTDFMVSSIADSRTHPDSLDVVGFLGTQCYLRARPDPDQTFDEYLRASSREWTQAFQNCFYPMSNIASRIMAERGQEGADFTPFGATSGADDPFAFELDQTRIEPIHRDFGGARMLPKLEIRDTRNGICLTISYQTAAFKKPSIERYVARYVELARIMTTHPERRLCELPDYLDRSIRPE